MRISTEAPLKEVYTQLVESDNHGWRTYVVVFKHTNDKLYRFYYGVHSDLGFDDANHGYFDCEEVEAIEVTKIEYRVVN